MGAFTIGIVALAIIATALFSKTAGAAARLGGGESGGQTPTPRPQPDIEPGPGGPKSVVIDNPANPDLPKGSFVSPGVDEPAAPFGPDPASPTRRPTPGFFFMPTKGDVPTRCAHECYPLLPKPLMLWRKVVSHPLNAHCLGHLLGGEEAGAFYPQWSGYLSPWGSGHQYHLVYWPTEKELPK